MSSTYMKTKLGIRRLVIVDHTVAAPTIGEAWKVDSEGVINSDLRYYEGFNPSSEEDLVQSECYSEAAPRPPPRPLTIGFGCPRCALAPTSPPSQPAARCKHARPRSSSRIAQSMRRAVHKAQHRRGCTR